MVFIPSQRSTPPPLTQHLLHRLYNLPYVPVLPTVVGIMLIRGAWQGRDAAVEERVAFRSSVQAEASRRADPQSQTTVTCHIDPFSESRALERAVFEAQKQLDGSFSRSTALLYSCRWFRENLNNLCCIAYATESAD